MVYQHHSGKWGGPAEGRERNVVNSDHGLTVPLTTFIKGWIDPKDTLAFAQGPRGEPALSNSSLFNTHLVLCLH